VGVTLQLGVGKIWKGKDSIWC